MKYISDSMISRRQRILETAQLLLSENDGQFTMRQLAKESGVATATLYNLYGSQEALIADAVADVFERRVTDQIIAPTDDGYLAATMARQAAAHQEIMRAPVFARKMVELYFNSEASSRIRDSLHTIPMEFEVQQLERLRNIGDLADWVAVDQLAGQITRATYSVIAAWAANEIADDDLFNQVLFASLMTVLGALTGDTRTQVEDALKRMPQAHENSARNQGRSTGTA